MAAFDAASALEAAVLIVLISVIPVTVLVRSMVVRRVQRIAATGEVTDRSLRSLLFWKKVWDKLVIASFAVVVLMVLWGVLLVI